MKLYCEEAFLDAWTVRTNRFFPLLTDGDNLFIIGIELKNVKRELKPELKSVYEELKKKEEEMKRKEKEENQKEKEKEEKEKEKKVENKKELKGKKKEPVKKSETSRTVTEVANICEFYLYEFDISIQNDQEQTKHQPSDNALVQELYSSFSGFFSHKECNYALKLNKNDIQVHFKSFDFQLECCLLAC